MADLSPKQTQRVDGLCRHCERLLTERAKATARLDPGLEPILDALIHRKLAEIRCAFESTRDIEGRSYLVADVLVTAVGDCEKCGPLFERDGAACLYDGIGPAEGGDGPVEIESLEDYYACLDFGLSSLARLVAFWAWWDLADAVDFNAFDSISKRRQVLASGELSEQVVAMYRKRLGREEGADVTREDILAHEAEVLRGVVERLERRREEEPVCRRLIACEPASFDGKIDDALVMSVASSLTAIERVQGEGELDPRARAYYGNMIDGEVTVEAIVDYERGNIERLKAKLVEDCGGGDEDDVNLYDLKALMVEDLRKRCETGA